MELRRRRSSLTFFFVGVRVRVLAHMLGGGRKAFRVTLIGKETCAKRRFAVSVRVPSVGRARARLHGDGFLFQVLRTVR